MIICRSVNQRMWELFLQLLMAIHEKLITEIVLFIIFLYKKIKKYKINSIPLKGEVEGIAAYEQTGKFK